ncbi:MAG: polyprenyl synthetase family protein [Thermoleophilia bacterium]|nr:polyprenyl synthetase family protein [Thermoleophilia bacterium]
MPRPPVTEAATPYPEHLRDMVEEYLEGLTFSSSDPLELQEMAGTQGLVEAMRHSLLAGGKRIRPVLALATAESLGQRAEDLLPAAAAIELVHTYSLIHDDLPAMDDDDLRRGRPTCHVLFGEDTAILAGDALFAEAVQLVAEHQPGSAETRVGILREISRATGVAGMVGGQYLDLKDAGQESPDALRRVHALKTGRLMSCAVHCALVLAQPEPEVDRALRLFARELGLLFQIVDDILDVEGSEEDLGKAVGADARQGKITYVSVHGIAEARRLAGEAHARALACLATLPGPTGDLVDITDLTYLRQH